MLHCLRESTSCGSPLFFEKQTLYRSPTRRGHRSSALAWTASGKTQLWPVIEETGESGLA